MINTKRIVIVFLVIGLIVLGIPVTAIETTFVVGNTSPEENTVDGSLVKETNENISASAKNETIQAWSPQAFAITESAAFSDSMTSRKVLIVSNSSTQAAGYTETEPASPLDVASYSSGAWLPAVSQIKNSAWYNNNTEPYGSGAEWISSSATTEGGCGDQWRLFQTEFVIPDGSTLTSAQLWYTPDNAASVYLNGDEINSTGGVYGVRPDGYPGYYARTFTVNFTPRTGSNTVKFVVRNWQTTVYNPTGLLYKVMIEYEPLPLIVNFTGKPTNGTAPLTVYFNDTSGWATSWIWSFGDGEFSTSQNTSHVYRSSGEYSVNLTGTNSEGSNTVSKTNFVNVFSQGPSANFTANLTTGAAPLPMQFTDTSSGNPNPNSWSWDFGDGGTSTAKNPQHTYSSVGNYPVTLTVANKKGSDTETKEGYVTVTEPVQTTFYVYADGVSQYHGFENNDDLYRASTAAKEFYTNISGKQGDPNRQIHWEGIGNPVDDATGSRNWNINEDANSMANNADFAFHAGHGWEHGILFGTANPSFKLYQSEMRFGGNNGKAKWVALLSCLVLNQTYQNDWKSVFNGLHILMGYDTPGLEGENQGSQFAHRMTGGGIYPAPFSIRDSWRETLQDTIHDEFVRGAYMWAEPSGDDYLAGFGLFREPIRGSDGQYSFLFESFNCIKSPE